MFSILFNKDKDSSILKGVPRKDKSLYSKAVSFCKNVFCKNEYEKRAEKDVFLEQYAFRSVSSFICERIEGASKKNTQGLSECFCSFVESINVNALNGLMINKACFRSLAEMNSIFCLSGINQKYYHPIFDVYEAHPSSAHVFTPFTSLPEYVFSGDYLRGFLGNPALAHYPKIIIFQRVFLEIFMASSILVQEYREAGTINNPLFERLVENGKELKFLLNRTHSDRDFVNFEMEREKSLREIPYEDVARLMIPYKSLSEAILESEVASESPQQNNYSLSAKRSTESTEKHLEVEVVELPPADLLGESEDLIENVNADVIQFLSKLEEDHHRRDIYFAIIAYEFVRVGNNLTFKSFWKWLEKYLADNPLQTRNIDGHEVKIFLSGGIIRHLGLLNNSTKDSQVQKSTFKTMYFKEIKPIIPKIKEFCMKRNIENIPIIP
ncbi:hypothetical protein [Maridesulfovibrio ferrireducens]|uniref:hypothetical protein n=1 Tax=Maridesulfovibrio ferrireducens TaxID=246191 RepID=UPI001A2A582C|nr:hypothetical protein [Maridesulfovibrio ferrireducens]MBI9109871.1 hypothetical protein [Maridesulfovibrio ferrireducens]